MVRIEVNVSVWNEMLSISWGRSLLYVARHSRRNNIAVYKDLRGNLCENMDIWLWSEITSVNWEKIGENLFESS